MIIRLTGGLGNQMFQYAYGRSKSIDQNNKFSYFFVHYKNDTDRGYKLSVFNVGGRKIYAFLPRLLVKLSDFFKINISGIRYGYWQSEKFFKKYERIIRKDFTFKNKPTGNNLKLLEKIESVNSVSLHVRRGDYVNDEKTKKFHGVQSMEYYKNAIDIIKNKVKDPVFFIFSDDVEWCKNNFSHLNEVIFVEENNQANDYEDLRLMSNCKHNIIANSSFSWWGAWLNTNFNKIVIAPKKWFIDKKAQKEIGDEIVPKTWIKI